MKRLYRTLNRLRPGLQVRYFPYAQPQPDRSFEVFDDARFRRVADAGKADWIVTMINSAKPRLTEEEISFLNAAGKPVLLLERGDSCMVWFRQFKEVRHLRYVLKNRNFRDLEWNNRPVFNWRMHLDRIRESLDLDRDFNESIPDASGNRGWGPLEPPLEREDLAKVRTLTWDFFSSPLGKPVEPHHGEPVPFSRRNNDVFCVSSGKRGILGQFRLRIKERVKEIGDRNGLKVVTGPLPKEKFNDVLRHSRISVSAPGWGEQVHADWYAVYSAVALFKQECDYVRQEPDLYRPEWVEFFDYRLKNLEEKILRYLEAFSENEARILSLRQQFVDFRKDDLRDRLYHLLHSGAGA